MEYLTQSEVEKVLRKAWKASPRDHLMLLLAFRHGLRVSEVAGLRVQDVSGGFLRVARLKGSLATNQPLLASSSPVFDEPSALQTWLEQKPEGESLFSLKRRQIEYLAQGYMLGAGVAPELAHMHTLKHACAANLLRNGMGVEFVRQFVGHKDINNTLRYLHITDKEATAKAQETFRKMEAQ